MTDDAGDRLLVSQIPREAIVELSYTTPLTELLDELGVVVARGNTHAVTNDRSSEPGPSTSYFVSEIVHVAGGADYGDAVHEAELLECTCPAFKYQCLPYAADVKAGIVGIDAIGECKHIRAYRAALADRQKSGE